jgi:hypothetical protein
MAYIRVDRAIVDRTRRNSLLSRFGRLADRLLRGFLAIKLSIKLRLPLFGIMLLAGCGAKDEKCYKNGGISFREIAADLCPHDPNYERALRELNPGVSSPKEADQQWFPRLKGGVCILTPPCLVREPETEIRPETRPEPIILPPPPPPPAPELRDVVEIREERDVYEAPADAGAAPAPDASTIPPTLTDAATEDTASPEDAARRRDAQRRENGGGRDNGTTLSDAGRPDRSFGVGGP